MKKTRWLFRAVTGVSILFILYALADNFVFDPGARIFLNYKTGLKHELKLPLWLNMMRIHVAFACLAMAAGLLNFSNRILDKSRKFHRINGYVYLISVLVVVLTSGYMAPYATGGKISGIGFNAINLLWLFITLMALIRIKQRRITAHRNWMIRSYAFCFTNMMIHLITSLVHHGFGSDYVTAYTISVYSSIALLLIIPDVIIRTLIPSRLTNS